MNLSDTPVWFRTRYLPASSADIRGASFGQVKRKRTSGDLSWKALRGTIMDPAIFGPFEDHRCACGKYKGAKFKGIICDRCGVKITLAHCRHNRMGHIHLPDPIPHPWSKSHELLSDIPVLPAGFLESEKGDAVAAAYESILDPSLYSDPAGVAATFDSIITRILPLAITGLQWNLPEHDRLTLALGLRPRDRESADALCADCGYPLEGLTVNNCPHCNKELTT